MEHQLIEWNTDLYHRVRSNFYKRYEIDTFMISSMFKDELRLHSGKKVPAPNMIIPQQQVFDQLGMNEYSVIEFDDEEKHFLFVMKWG